MRSISSIGETVLDIIIKDGKPLVANPGGSVLNTMVSLGRLGADTRFITELGKDEPGAQVKIFLRDNGIDTSCIAEYDDMQTPIALAYLDDSHNASYTFYKQYPSKRFQQAFPALPTDGYFLFASSLALNEQVRPTILALIAAAVHSGNTIYYDPNCRPNPASNARLQNLLILENMREAHIVRGSDEDFNHIFGHCRLDEIWQQIDSPRLQMLICTRGAQGVSLMRRGQIFDFGVPQIVPVSTVGAGDTFNAGFIYGLAARDIGTGQLEGLSEDTLRQLCDTASACAAHVCCSLDNYISAEFAQSISLH